MTRMGWAAALAVVVAGLLAGATETAAAARTRIYLAFVSHNEYSGSNEPCRWLASDQARFAANRAAVLQVASLIAARQGAYDLQTDWEFALRVAQWETDAMRTSTSGMNLLQYLAAFAPDRVVVDAHSHESLGFNYADVAYMVEQLTGRPSTGIVGGFTAAPAVSANWERFRQPLVGQQFPQYAWQPVALWGGGSAGHRADPTASGVWRPASEDDFFTDDPAHGLVNIGSYSFGALDPSGAVDLVTRLRAGTLEPGRLYTATLMLPQCEFDVNPAVVPYVTAVLDAAAPYVAAGDIVWATLPQVLEAWRDEYDAAPVVLRP
ncbi:MAG: hypothetical protein AB7O67_06755 [Vicinamibacterales bacterium]